MAGKVNNRRLHNKSPELLADLASHVAASVKSMCGVPDLKADEVGQAVADLMSQHWGGQVVYFPFGLLRKLSKRNMQIYSEFNGSNHQELVSKWGISLQWLYRIIDLAHKEEISRRQNELFDSDELS